jgi:hypothetical protein
MNNKIIINKDSITTDAEAMYKVYQVIAEGLVSETSKGKQYCFATRFNDGYVVTCDKTKTGYSFRVGKEKE